MPTTGRQVEYLPCEAMLVKLIKHESRPHTLECIREDGTRTWFTSRTNSEFFARHDLIHFAVESILGYRHAFYGMVASGRDLDDFGTQGGGKDERDYHPEALFAEQLVGLLSSDCCDTYSKFKDILGQLFIDEPRPAIDEGQYDLIKARTEELLADWTRMGFEDALELKYQQT